MTYVVESVSEREVNTKFGAKKAYDIVANGEKFSYGFKKPSFGVGDTVKFEFTDSTYGKQVDVLSLQVLAKGVPGAVIVPSTPPLTTAATGRSGGYTPPSKPFPIPPLHGDRAIVRQNSITNATKLVTELLVPGAGADFDTIAFEKAAEKIIAIAKMFEAYSTGDLDMAEALKGE